MRLGLDVSEFMIAIRVQKRSLTPSAIAAPGSGHGKDGDLSDSGWIPCDLPPWAPKGMPRAAPFSWCNVLGCDSDPLGTESNPHASCRENHISRISYPSWVVADQAPPQLDLFCQAILCGCSFSTTQSIFWSSTKQCHGRHGSLTLDYCWRWDPYWCQPPIRRADWFAHCWPPTQGIPPPLFFRLRSMNACKPNFEKLRSNQTSLVFSNHNNFIRLFSHINFEKKYSVEYLTSFDTS